MAERLIVEAFGMPGVGKSHIMRRAVELCQRDGIGVVTEGFEVGQGARWKRILIKCANIVAESPRLIAHSPEIVRMIAQSPHIRIDSALFNWMQLLGLTASRSRVGEPLMLQQGFFQGFWSIVLRNQGALGDLEGWWNLTRSIIGGSKVLVVVVEARPEVIRSRLEQRSGGRSLLDAHLDEWNNAMRTTRHVLEAIEMVRSRDVSLDMVRVFNDDDNPPQGVLDKMIRSSILGPVQHHISPCSGSWHCDPAGSSQERLRESMHGTDR